MQSVTLIIDKRKELSVKYKKLLENDYNSVEITRDIISSLKFIQDKEPDLIIISESADSENSLCEFCKKIRALTYNMRPIIIGISKSADWQDRINALESGADDFISEPINNDEFVMRIKAHLRREFESNLDENKLLPNKNYSIRSLKRIINSNEKWATMLISIENFDNYRETYTELASDKLLRTFIAIMVSAMDYNDFLGNFSKNEFLLITNPTKAEHFANFLTFAFDSVSSKFYSQEDLKRGFMIMNGDETAGRRSDFVHTTIGVISNEFSLYNDVSQALTALKHTHDLADLPSKSNYLMERPKISAKNAIFEKQYNNKVVVLEKDEALKLLLKTFLGIQGFEYTEANTLEELQNNPVSPAIIIIDIGENENSYNPDTCKQLRKYELFNNTKIIATSVLHDKERILSCGADLYLPKPYDLSNLLKWINFFVKEINR